jgi:hypothetical protein
MQKLEYSLPPINGLLSFPTEEIMQYWLNENLLDSPGLLMHIILGRILVFQLAKALPKNIDFDLDTALSLTTIYHATRQNADYGKSGIHIDSQINEFMKFHGDMDYALLRAREKWLSSAVIKGISDYLITPKTRENWYFPHETLQKEGKINWTETIPMLTSWLVVGVITRIDKRFNDLRARRSAEIGKLELPYWKAKIDAGESISLPKPIVDIALKDENYTSEADIISWIGSWIITDAVMGKWILDGYEEWANEAIAEYSKLIWVDDFYAFLEKEMDTLWDAEVEKKAKIKQEFELMLGRPLKDWEFIPYIEGIDLLYKRIRWLKADSTRKVYREKIERSMRNISRVVEKLGK